MSEKDSAFVLVEASKLSLDDKFMKYYPETNNQRLLMRRLVDIINRGISDFYRPLYDPSFSDNDSCGIQFVTGQKPAMGKDYDWWKKAAESFCENSRLGNVEEYSAFAGVIIKKLVERGWAVPTAWYVVCNDSHSIGRYRNSFNASSLFANTGTKEVCGFFDLANTFKMLDSNSAEDDFILASGAVNFFADNYPVAMVHKFKQDEAKYLGYVGWVIIPAIPKEVA